MTPNPAQIMGNRTLFDALALMTERNIHHLPVIDQKTLVPLGMVTASDIIRHQRGNVLFIIGELSKAENLYELTRLSWQLPHYFYGSKSVQIQVASQQSSSEHMKELDEITINKNKKSKNECPNQDSEM